MGPVHLHNSVPRTAPSAGGGLPKSDGDEPRHPGPFHRVPRPQDPRAGGGGLPKGECDEPRDMGPFHRVPRPGYQRAGGGLPKSDGDEPRVPRPEDPRAGGGLPKGEGAEPRDLGRFLRHSVPFPEAPSAGGGLPGGDGDEPRDLGPFHRVPRPEDSRAGGGLPKGEGDEHSDLGPFHRVMRPGVPCGGGCPPKGEGGGLFHSVPCPEAPSTGGGLSKEAWPSEEQGPVRKVSSVSFGGTEIDSFEDEDISPTLSPISIMPATSSSSSASSGGDGCVAGGSGRGGGCLGPEIADENDSEDSGSESVEAKKAPQAWYLAPLIVAAERRMTCRSVASCVKSRDVACLLAPSPGSSLWRRRASTMGESSAAGESPHMSVMGA